MKTQDVDVQYYEIEILLGQSEAEKQLKYYSS